MLRRPDEAIAVLDQNFSRRGRLVILTDESDDPFLKPIVEAFTDSVFGHLILLDELGGEFRDLPQHECAGGSLLESADGTMVEQFAGPHSWNRYDPLLHSAWMREWPESFLPDPGAEPQSSE